MRGGDDARSPVVQPVLAHYRRGPFGTRGTQLIARDVDTNVAMVRLYAHPYDLDASGFSFDCSAAFERRRRDHRNYYGQSVEEYEFFFVAGTSLDAELFDALGICQDTLARFFEILASWTDDEKRRVIVAVSHCGCAFNVLTDQPDDLDVEVWEVDSLHDLAVSFVSSGMLGPVSDALASYVNHEALARDLACYYAEAFVAGTNVIYRCC